ncbi:hypothetical protein P872_11155 [Rhodonellum psychrophilum GCM71 = DSM 17998]|uniref:Uncharacterized protein n=1 Tax=Rhodonellum psychrophilum GCM71 = DSM 17998 TaxID=1123057 RepID=U5BWA1_9BACT|nr:hypothetical protein P872_11155 [Rhodonellum psychrophilum GCM71 = DSM 17998]
MHSILYFGRIFEEKLFWTRFMHCQFHFNLKLLDYQSLFPVFDFMFPFPMDRREDCMNKNPFELWCK